MEERWLTNKGYMIFLFLELRIPVDKSGMSIASQNEVRLVCAGMYSGSEEVATAWSPREKCHGKRAFRVGF